MFNVKKIYVVQCPSIDLKHISTLVEERRTKYRKYTDAARVIDLWSLSLIALHFVDQGKTI